MAGIRGQDVVLLLKLVSLQEQENVSGLEATSDRRSAAHYSVRNLEAVLGISKTEVSASLKRCLATDLAVAGRRSTWPSPNRRNLHNFIVHGLKYVFPAELGAMNRGAPTSFAAPMLTHLLLNAGTYNCVWPFAEGEHLGQSVKPLFKSVPKAVQTDDRLYEYLALVDAIRLGRQREADVASARLRRHLLGG